MPNLEDKVYHLDTRVSEVEKDISTVLVKQQHQNRRSDDLENTVIRHMAQEEKDREVMEGKMDGLIRYKWILFGMMLMMWLTSGDNQLLQLLKVIG